MKYFYVINIKDKNLSALIDGIRVIADPYIKHPAHITVRGPYTKKYNFDRVNKDLIGSKIHITGVGNFFEYNQNTIYFDCESNSLEKASLKRDYPDSFNPHITLYDGNDRPFSEKLNILLSKYNFSFNIYSAEIEPLKSRDKGGAKNDIRFILRDEFYSNLSYYLQSKIDYNDILSLDEESKLDLIKKLCDYFKKCNNPNVYASPIQSLIEKLNLNENNGLFYFTDIRNWENKFPYRIIRALKEIRPYAFHCLYKNDIIKELHPKPFNQPFILFFDNPIDEDKIHRQVFSFGQAPIVFIERINSLEILNGYEFLKNEKKLKIIGDSNSLKYFTLENLIYGQSLGSFYHSHFNNVKRVDDYLLENISEVRGILINQLKLPPNICNNLIGRLIFIRYLIDRGVIFKDDHIHFFEDYDKTDRNNFFIQTIKDKTKIYDFFDFLRNRLNGDLFPVTNIEKELVNQEHLNLLFFLFKGGEIYGSNNDDYFIQDSLFDIYDFKIIPIELISNIYENFIGESTRIQNKAFYTPSFLVDFVLSQTVTKHLEENDSVSCKILDPSCGSGIFLIETLRKLIEKYKEQNGNQISDYHLWKLVEDNIYGIDIDSNAIDIAIFSLYVTILDYKEPKEISNNFKFKELKNINFFPNADFFDENHAFNKVLNGKKLDFVIGNPPWGHVKNSCYVDYIKSRKILGLKDNLSIDIGSKEISQAFLIRVNDFLITKNDTRCSFIISSKAFYNTNKTSQNWRNFILNKFIIEQITELSPVNNKIAGGNHIFEGARQPAAIITFRLPKNSNEIEKNKITHISIKPYLNYKFFKSFVVTDFDLKQVPQKMFNASENGYDWLWKVLLHGNILDFKFIKRLKDDFPTILDFDSISLPKEGMKYKDGNKKFKTKHFLKWNFLETDKMLNFYAPPGVNWESIAEELASQDKIDFEYNVGYLPDTYYFQGKKVLIREALTKDFNAHCYYTEDEYIFNQSISSLKLKKGIKESEKLVFLLKSIAGLYNSKLFTYYIFHTSSSAGVDRARAIINEFLSFPIKEHKILADITMQIQELYKNYFNCLQIDYQLKIEKQISIKKLELDNAIFDIYNLNEIERSLIDYTINVSIPLLKRNEIVFRSLNLTNKLDILYFEKYLNIYLAQLKKQNNLNYLVEVVQSVDFLGVFFKPSNNSQIKYSIVQDLNNIVDFIGSIGINHICKNLYNRKSLIGKENFLVYIIKPNEYKSWHEAIAHYELTDGNSVFGNLLNKNN